MTRRKLRATERKFVAEGEAGCFRMGFGADGSPYAMGACHTGSLFSMEVLERGEPTPGESVYRLTDDYYDHDFAGDAP